MPLIRDIFWQHKRRYGARRIAVEMQARGHACGVDRVAKLLKIRACRPFSRNPSSLRQRTAGMV
jgi:transposase InsO family protein